MNFWIGIIACLVLFLGIGVYLLFDKAIRYIDKLSTVINAMAYAYEDSEINYIQRTYGYFIVFLSDLQWVRKIVNDSENTRIIWKCYKNFGIAVANAVRKFRLDGLSLNIQTFRGVTDIATILSKDEVIYFLTDGKGPYKSYVKIKLSSFLTKKIFIAWGVQFYMLDDPYLYDLVKDHEFNLRALKLRYEDNKFIGNKVNQLIEYSNGIFYSPEIASLKHRFTYRQWCNTAKEYNSIKKRFYDFQEYTSHGYVYIINSDYKGDRWPAAMGKTVTCNPSLYEKVYNCKKEIPVI